MATFDLQRFGQMAAPGHPSVGGVYYDGPSTFGSVGQGSIGGLAYDIPNVVEPQAVTGMPGGSGTAVGAGALTGLAGLAAGYATKKGLQWAFDPSNVPIPIAKPGTGDLMWGNAGAQPGQSYNPYPEDPGIFAQADGMPVAGAEGSSWLPSSWDYGSAGSSLVNMGLDAAGGYLAGRAGFGGSDVGRDIGTSVGSAIGAYAIPIPFAGSLFGGAIGGMIGSNFGPAPTVGPNGALNFGVDANGRLTIPSYGGDNGFDAGGLYSAAQEPVMNFNNLLAQYGGRAVPHAQMGVSFEGSGSDPMVSYGRWAGPLLNENSLFKGMLQHGGVEGLDEQQKAQLLAALGGPDPEHALWGSKWYRPENLHPTVQAALQQAGFDDQKSQFWEVGDLPAWMTGFQASGAGSDTYTPMQPGQRPSNVPVGNPWYSGPTEAPAPNIPDWYGGNTA